MQPLRGFCAPVNGEMDAEEKTKWTMWISAIGFGIGLLAIFIERLTGAISPADFLMGATTFFLGIVTFYLVFTQLTEGRTNRNQFSKLAARDRAISNYPLLSQKIITEGVAGNVVIGEDTQHYATHYILKIKNFGKGPAIDQDKIQYIFFKGENKIHQNLIRITGAHDMIAPDDERPLDMTKLSENDWNIGMETQYENIWVRLPHQDILRNKCCNCTTYKYEPALSAKFGKIERHWYFASYPEISSEECKKCEWLALDDVTE